MGGKSGSSSQQFMTDPEAARRMAAVSERQQDMAEEQWATGKELYQPYEKAMIQTNTALLPKLQEVTESEIGENLWNMGKSRGVKEQFLSEATKGVNAQDRMAQATADVASAFNGAEAQQRRSALRMGVRPDSGAMASMGNQIAMERAKAVGAARTGARMGAEGENFQRLGSAAQMFAPAGQGITQVGNYQMNNPLDRSQALYSNVINANQAGMSPLSKSQSSAWNFQLPSSIRYKKDVEPIVSIGMILDDLEPVTYTYKNGNNKHYGFIAEEVAKVFPEGVFEKEGKIDGVLPYEFIALLVAEVKSLRKRVDELEGDK